ncbi:hypothetical protein CCACVL1_08133 [Corchorus capsularis]|uniref:Uncharacterized protein n=1 Tax=Corchorus capsularis TaxID=210143 RepID=A0A1R3J236_COCAP|nr:hypothetical protein CCACVL1_08133 [Corchorus capsularis]
MAGKPALRFHADGCGNFDLAPKPSCVDFILNVLHGRNKKLILPLQ